MYARVACQALGVQLQQLCVFYVLPEDMWIYGMQLFANCVLQVHTQQQQGHQQSRHVLYVQLAVGVMQVHHLVLPVMLVLMVPMLVQTHQVCAYHAMSEHSAQSMEYLVHPNVHRVVLEVTAPCQGRLQVQLVSIVLQVLGVDQQVSQRVFHAVLVYTPQCTVLPP